MKKIIIIVIALFFLNNCGYTPIYSSTKNNFNINKISQKDTSKLNSKFISIIEKFSNKNGENIIELEISSNKKIQIISKDAKGDPSRYQMKILLNVNIINLNYNQTNKGKKFSANFDYSNNSNRFSLRQYEKEIENNLVD